VKQYLEVLLAGRDLSRAEMVAAFDLIMSGEATEAQIAAFIIALRMKGESVDEIAGAVQSMRQHALFVDPHGLPVVDTVGTGGDGSDSFNVSTTASFVVAGAGVPVAKHGNRAVSSKCGAADVLMALGVNVEGDARMMERCLQEVGIGFLYAIKLHPAMKHAIGPRRELGVRTIFNMIGPLTNPAGAKRQVIGVFAKELTETFARVLQQLGSERALVVHGDDGMDEITTTTTSTISELHAGEVTTYSFDPKPLIGEYATAADLVGGDPATNAAITRAILEGEKGPKRDITCINAAATLVASDRAATIAEGYPLACASIDSGAALAKLDQLIAVTNSGE
jgi:anthranilate phosphoribosyltransferase